VEQALPAEMELGLLWGLLKLGDVEVEPAWFALGSLPDAYSELLFAPRPAAIEIAAISDASLAQEDEMRRTASLLCEAANRIRRGEGHHLHFFLAAAKPVGQDPGCSAGPRAGIGGHEHQAVADASVDWPCIQPGFQRQVRDRLGPLFNEWHGRSPLQNSAARDCLACCESIDGEINGNGRVGGRRVQRLAGHLHTQTPARKVGIGVKGQRPLLRGGRLAPWGPETTCRAPRAAPLRRCLQ